MNHSGVILLMLTLAIGRLPAQLPAGSMAPDFTVTDVAGQTWQLYELLAQDKIVVLEIGATWCSPCWAYHNGGALQEFYAAHGPSGDGRAQVLFIESDPNTSVECLYGETGCNGVTLGNWVEGSPFPVINDDAIAEAFQLTYYPSLFVICPNRKAYEVGQFSADQLWEKANQCPVALGNNNAGIFDFFSGSDLHEICNNLQLAPTFQLTNLGSTALTSALIQLRWNNTPLQNLQWTGNLPLYGEAAISFDTFALSGTGLLETKVVQVNYLANDDDTTNNIQLNHYVQAANFNSPKVILKIRTDNFGAETYWELRDDTGYVLDHGGNEAVGPTGGGKYFGITGGPGAYGDLAFIKDTLDLPAGGCYSIHFVDAYGDGMCCGFGSGFYRLYNLDEPNVPVLSGGEFAAYDHRGFGAQGATGVAEVAAAWLDWQLFPNPAAEELHLHFQLPAPMTVTSTVVDAQGKIVYRQTTQQAAGEHDQVMGVADWQPGLYFLHWQADGYALTRSFLVAR